MNTPARLSLAIAVTALMSLGTATPALALQDQSNVTTLAQAFPGEDLVLNILGGFFHILGGFLQIGGNNGSGGPDILSTSTVSYANSSTISWTTDQAANSTVLYGLTSSYGSSTASASLTNSHALTVTGLASTTIYHYAIVSESAFGKTSTTSDQTFETSSTELPLDTNGWTILTPSTGTGTCNNSATGSYTGTCIIYVASPSDSTTPGNDSNNCVAPPPLNQNYPTPCATLSHAIALMRTGFPDWVLLKRGDVWVGQEFGNLVPAGESATQPEVLGAYGTSTTRPLIEVPPGQSAVSTFHTPTWGDYLVIDGLNFYAYTRDPSNPNFIGPTPDMTVTSTATGTDGVLFTVNSTAGVTNGDWLVPSGVPGFDGTVGGSAIVVDGTHVDIVASSTNDVYGSGGTLGDWEGNQVSGINLLNPAHLTLEEDDVLNYMVGAVGINSQLSGLAGNLTIRRSIIENTYTTTSGHAEGIFADYVSDLNLVEDVWDSNGWSLNSTIEGVSVSSNPIFSRNIYISQHDPIDNTHLLGNIIFGTDGAQLRAGGYAVNNLFLKNTIGLLTGGQSTDESNNVIDEGGAGTVVNNVFMEGADYPEQAIQGGCVWARGLPLQLQLTNATTSFPSIISGNIMADSISACSDPAIDLNSPSSDSIVTNNIVYNMQLGSNPGIIDDGTDDVTTPNQIGLPSSDYPNASSTVETYDSSVLGGPGTLADFMAKEDAQSHANWNTALTADAVNNYIRSGFGVAAQ